MLSTVGQRRWSATLVVPAALAVLVAVLSAFSCRPAGDRGGSDLEPAPGGPILMITLEGLRADVVGALGGLPGLTPAVDALAAEADWFGSAVSASSASAPAMVSLLTGLRPHDHRAWNAAAPLRAQIETLPEALRARGYATRAYLSSEWLRASPSFLQGFDEVQPLAIVRAAERDLRAAAGAPALVLVEIAAPAPPYRLYPALLPRLEALGDRVARDDLPERLGLGEVRELARSAQELGTDELGTWWAMYCLNVARADQRVGQLLDALRESGAWDRSTVVVTSLRGEPLGDDIGDGLRRRLIEVPLIVKLPAGAGALGSLPAPGSLLETTSLWATLVELAGGSRPPGVTPGWFEGPGGLRGAGAWSERRTPAGRLQVSWISGDEQVLLELDRSQRRVVGEVWRWLPDGGERLSDRASANEALQAETLRRWRLLAQSAGQSPIESLERAPRPRASSRGQDS
ncbi:MAG TPA: sulfatase-like hydrolase/transferase [Thermoanaerobaculia bacterium]|nr:sulfatase-like hydrolase/transferase [Thermoanaerobaculia bacterium]